METYNREPSGPQEHHTTESPDANDSESSGFDLGPYDSWDFSEEPLDDIPRIPQAAGTSIFDPAPHHWPELGPPSQLTEEELEEQAQMHVRLQRDLDEGYELRQHLWAELNIHSELDKEKSEMLSPMQMVGNENLNMADKDIHEWEDYKSWNQSETNDDFGDWPRRLLHVPSMTSYEWQTGNQYGPFINPKYAAISYTWGRWMLADGVKPWIQSLKVENTSWAIPRVDEDLFTLAEFQRAIQTCISARDSLNGLEFIWLDVACINQNKGDTSGALEIGRQAKIFGGADRVFVWLAGHTIAQPRGRWDSFDSALDFIAQAASITQILLPKILEEKAKLGDDLRIDNRRETRELPDDLFDQEGDLADLDTCIAFVTKAPWFSSLWTLQEAFLRTDSFFLMPDGTLLERDSGSPFTLSSLVQACGIIHKACTASAEARLIALKEKSFHEQALLHNINSKGLDALSSRNPMALYTGANRRQTKRPLDRIYGIMQVFRFQLGKASPAAIREDPTKEWTLEELEVEMGAALIEQYPLMSQLHVHRSSVEGRQAWRISNSSVIPALARDLPYTEHGEIQGKVDRCSSELSVKKAGNHIYGNFKGNVCSFETIKDAWAAADAQKEGTGCGDFTSVVQIALDATVFTSKDSFQVQQNLYEIPRNHQQHLLADLLASKLRDAGKKAIVVLLGRILIGEETRTELNPLVSTETYVGMIVMECRDTTVGRWWKRLGICTWDGQHPTSNKLSPEDLHFSLLTGETLDWAFTDGIFG